MAYNNNVSASSVRQGTRIVVQDVFEETAARLISPSNQLVKLHTTGKEKERDRGE